MLPVPRTALPSRFSMQMDTAPLNATFAYARAAVSISPCPPIQRKTRGAPSSNTVENAAARPRARKLKDQRIGNVALTGTKRAGNRG